MYRTSGGNLAKVLALVLATFMMLTVVAGCGEKTAAGNDSNASATQASSQEVSNAPAASTIDTAPEEIKPEPGAKLKIWGPDPATGAENSGVWLQDIAKEFEQKYGVTFTFEPVAPQDTAQKLAQDGPAKQAADVFIMTNDHLGEVVAAGLVYPNESNSSVEFLESAVKACSINGKLYGYPISIETYGLFYNKKLVSTPPKAYQEVIDFAKGFNDVKNKKYGFMFEPDNFYFSYQFIAGYGGYVFGKNGTDANDIGLNNEGAVEGIKFFQSLKEILPVNSADITGDVRDGLFKEGKLAIQISGPWSIQPYTSAGIDFGVAPLPTLPNGKNPISFSGVKGLYVNSYTDYPVAAKMFAQYCESKESLLKLFKTTGQIPPRKDLADEPDIKNDANTAAFLQQAQYSEAMPSIPQMGAVWNSAKTALASIWNDKADPKTTLDNAVKMIKEANVQTTK